MKNPASSPFSNSFAGSVFDHVYLVHPDGSDVDLLSDLLDHCTPLGLMLATYEGTLEVLKPKPNPFLSADMKRYFLNRLDALRPTRSFA